MHNNSIYGINSCMYHGIPHNSANHQMADQEICM